MRRKQRWIRDIIVVVAAVLAMIFTANDKMPDRRTSNPRVDSSNNFRAKDGDSLDRGGTDIRLHGIDAPELRQTCEDDQGNSYPCGKRAADALRDLIRGRTITCTRIARDRYRRDVSTCKAGELNINGEMVRLGWALAYRRHSQSYIELERQARQGKRGIWRGRFEIPEEYRKRQARVTGDLSTGADEFSD